MQWLKIGNRFINMNEVIDVDVSANGVTLYFSVARQDQPHFVSLTGDAAAALRKWLEANSTDTGALPAEGSAAVS